MQRRTEHVLRVSSTPFCSNLIELRVDILKLLAAYCRRICIEFPDKPGCQRTSRHLNRQVILSANGDAAQSAFGGIVVESQAGVVEAARQRGPARPHIAKGPGELGLARVGAWCRRPKRPI